MNMELKRFHERLLLSVADVGYRRPLLVAIDPKETHRFWHHTIMTNPTLVAAKNNEHLATLGYKIPAHLPTIELLEELQPQSDLSVAQRSVVLVQFVMLGYDCPVEKVRAALDELSIYEFASGNERALLTSEVKEQDKINCTWLTECLQALSWCFEDSKLDFDYHCDDDLNTKFPEPFTSPIIFLEESTLRPFDEIYTMADLHYRYHWLSRQGEKLSLSESAIKERRRALDWVIGTERNWDEVPLDT